MALLPSLATFATAVLFFVQFSECSAQASTGTEPHEAALVQLRLTEVLRIGSSDGTETVGRVMSGAFDGSGRIVVTDDQNQRVSVFSPDGALLRHIGEGEFEQPWLVAVDETDSIFVWDQGRSLLSVFSPDLVFRRSFSLPPEWLPRSLGFLPSGDLVLAVSGPADTHGLYVVTRTGERSSRGFGNASPAGNARVSEGPRGGVLDVGADELAYARSPAEIVFYMHDGHARATCRDRSRTADVTNGSEAAELNRFVHSVGIIALGNHLYLHLIRDPIRNVRVLELLRSDCTRLRKTELGLPLSFLARHGDLLLALRTLDFAELVVYRFELVNRSSPPSAPEHLQEVQP